MRLGLSAGAVSYQLALVTPGTSPLLASMRKQMRQMRNFRM